MLSKKSAAQPTTVTLCRASRKQQVLQSICQKLPIHQNSASFIALYSVCLLAISEHKESGKGLQATSWDCQQRYLELPRHLTSIFYIPSWLIAHAGQF